MVLPGTEEHHRNQVEGSQQDNLSSNPIRNDNSFDLLEDENFDAHSQELNLIRRPSSEGKHQDEQLPSSQASPTTTINITNVKSQMKKESTKIPANQLPKVEDDESLRMSPSGQ